MNKSQSNLISKVTNKGFFVLSIAILILSLRLAKNSIVSRILEPELRGIWGLLNIIPDFLVSIGNLGLGSAITYYIGKKIYSYQYGIGIIVFSCFYLGIPLGIAAWFVIGAGFFLEGNATLLLPYKFLIMVITPFFLLKTLSSAFLIGTSKVEKVTIYRLLESLFPLAFFLLFYFAFSFTNLDAATYSWFVGVCLAISFLVFMLPIKDAFPPLFSIYALKKFLGYGLRGHLGNFFNLIILRIDIMFISYFLTARDLGYYIVATSFSELLMLVPDSLIIPFTGILFAEEEKTGDLFAFNVLRLIFWVMLIVCFIAMIISKPFLYLLFGSNYMPALKCILLLIPGIFFLSIFYALKVAINNKGKPGLTSVVAGMAAFINVVLNFLFIPKYGIEGAALSASVSYMFCALLMLIIYSKLSNCPVLKLYYLSTHDIHTVYDFFHRTLYKISKKS